METTLPERLATIVAANTTPLRSTTPRAVIIAELVNRIEKLETALRILATEVEQLDRRSAQTPPPLLDPSTTRRFRRGRHRRPAPPA